ncbi:MAG: Methionyl-tRNA formyltransferase [Verrucomicrobiales bacterium]|nr:Methionyl-tRNA formyltransferase [Verrucomicrobiales bacterium]
MGTAELACASLEALSQDSGMQVVAVVTQPDRPKGRDLKLQPSAVKELALRKNLPVLQPEKARHESFIQILRELNPDLIVVAAYGQILPQTMLDLPRFGCLNVHTSLLPKYRGAAPIQWAILNGDAETGVTIMKMDAGLDTGDMLATVSTRIEESDDAQTLHDRLAQLGAELLMKTIPEFVAGKITPQKQPEGSTYARKITREDARFDWTKPARDLWNQLRAFTPWPGAFTFQAAQPKPRLLKIWKVEMAPFHGKPGEVLSADRNGIVVACGQDALRILVLQREGGKRLNAQDFLSGSEIKAGDYFD